MKRIFWFMVSISLLIALSSSGGNMFSDEALAQDKSIEGFTRNIRKQVALMVCETWISNPPVMTVLASSSSEGAPDIPLGIECAEAIALLLNAGFRMQNTTDIYGLRVHYTFIK